MTSTTYEQLSRTSPHSLFHIDCIFLFISNSNRKTLSILEEDVDFFMENGYVVIKNAFSKEKADEWTKDLWVRLGMDPNDKSTWVHEDGRVHMPAHKRELVSTFSPKVI